ncbi:hypothetical protein PMIN04_006699 [Paraphaeosphaeria minitans]
MSLLELTTCPKTGFFRYAMMKNLEIEDLKAQIETHNAEMDLIGQGSYGLGAEKEGDHGEDASGEEVEADRGEDA